MSRETRGWERISPLQVKDYPDAQIVCGQWYRPCVGSDSLQEVIDELEQAWLWIYGADTCIRGDERVGITSDGRHALRMLKQWGLLDEKGERIDDTETETGEAKAE